jgi:GTPase SAR1 family protein
VSTERLVARLSHRAGHSSSPKTQQGAGESGKSTILKQMQILHKNGWTNEEKLRFRPIILQNLLGSMQTLCRACIDLSIKHDTANEKRAGTMLSLTLADMDETKMGMFSALWADGGVKQAIKRQVEFHLIDSAEFVLQHTARLLSTKYVPTEQDILRSRIATTGIVNFNFVIDDTNFKMFDVGGQRGERKRWMHCFSNVNAILFITSLVDYYQVLSEDRTKNRLDESLDLFEGIVNLPWFKNTSIILFLNKKDLFEKKVLVVDIGIYHPAYTGGLDYDLGIQYITDEYLSRNRNSKKKIFSHITDATDTENIQFVWKVAKHTIMHGALKGTGLLM